MGIDFARMHNRGDAVHRRADDRLCGGLGTAMRRAVAPRDFYDAVAGTEWRTSAATMGAVDLAFNVPGGLFRAAVRGAGLREGGGS